MSKDFIAVIREESTRQQEWMNVFGSSEISIKSPIPHEASAPGRAILSDRSRGADRRAKRAADKESNPMSHYDSS